MIVHGGEPPFVEEPNPRFGGVITELNNMANYVQEKTTEFNEGTKGRLHEFTDNLNAFINDVAIPITNHLNARGAVHKETKKTISLGLKDNFRAATLAEQIALANVDAFVTPQGAKQAIIANQATYTPAGYQQNDVIQMAGYFFPDEYPTLIPTRPEPIRYLTDDVTNGRTPVLINGDRLVFSPRQNVGLYQRQSLFVSGPTKVARKTQLEEIQNVANYYTGLGWNNIAGVSSAGTVGFFYPIADKKIYEFKNNTGLPASDSRAFLLFRGYGGHVYKGMGVSVVPDYANGTFAVHHRFFRVNSLETDPTMVNVVDGNYQATYTLKGGTSVGPAQSSHTYNVADFIALPAGSRAVIGGDAQGVSTSLFWSAQDYEAYLFIAVSLTITLADGTERYVTLRFLESIIPGTLRPGGTARFTTLGNLAVKDSLPADLTIPEGRPWIEQGNRWNMNSPVHLPGAVLDNGEIVKAKAGKYSLRVKRFTNDLKGIRAWTLGPRPVVSMKEATSEIMVPARHACFTALPDRIIPFKHTPTETSYLVYGLDVSLGRYRWQEMAWNRNSIVGAVAGNKFGITVPDIIMDRDNLLQFPTAISCYASSSVDGVSLSAMGFTKNNNYRGYSSMSFVNGVLTLGSVLLLSPATLISLQAMSGGMMDRARARSPFPANIERFRDPQIQVWALTGNKAVFMLSDGLCHAEVGIAPYTIIGDKFVLDFLPSNGVKTTIITQPGAAATGLYRVSGSGDGVRLSFNDLMAIQTGADTFSMALTRPFGDMYGDLSFNVSSYGASATPTITPVVVNPARMYASSYSIDAVEELYPAFVIPKKGLYQYDPANTDYTTNCKNVANQAEVVDPFDINEAGWVRVPSGAKVFIGGRTYVLDKDFAVKVNLTGVSYCYLVRRGDTLAALASPTIRETSNNEVLFGTATNGILDINKEYLVLDRHLLSATRRGSAIPYFEDDGNLGPNRFFTQRDRI